MLLQKPEGGLAFDGVRAVKKIDLSHVGQTQFEIAPVGARIFIGDAQLDSISRL